MEHLFPTLAPGGDVWSTGSQGSPSPFGIFRGLDGTEGEKSTNPDDTKRLRPSRTWVWKMQEINNRNFHEASSFPPSNFCWVSAVVVLGSFWPKVIAIFEQKYLFQGPCSVSIGLFSRVTAWPDWTATTGSWFLFRKSECLGHTVYSSLPYRLIWRNNVTP